jgi:hypothetical protein
MVQYSAGQLVGSVCIILLIVIIESRVSSSASHASLSPSGENVFSNPPSIDCSER